MYRQLPAIRPKKGIKKEEEYQYQSRFGSHASMEVKEETERLHDDKLAVLKDERGLYLTQRAYLDLGLADPNRFATLKKREELLEKALGEVINITMS